MLASAVPYLPVARPCTSRSSTRSGPRPVRGVAVRTADGSTFVSPDNGLTSAGLGGLRRRRSRRACSTTATCGTPRRRAPSAAATSSRPVAARLAAGLPTSSEVGTARRRRRARAARGARARRSRTTTCTARSCRSTTSATSRSTSQRSHLEQAGITLGDEVELRCSGKTLIVPFLETYGQAGRGRLVVCEDSFRTVTLAVNQGSAAPAAARRPRRAAGHLPAQRARSYQDRSCCRPSRTRSRSPAVERPVRPVCPLAAPAT